MKTKLSILITTILTALITYLTACTFNAEKIEMSTDTQSVEKLADSLAKPKY